MMWKQQDHLDEGRSALTPALCPGERECGFTLIELLVVVTIIVVLMALLAPAMDKAIYQAELAVCGTKLRGTAGGTLTYAMDYGRRYPYRKVVADGGGLGPTQLAVPPLQANVIFAHDLRPVIKDHIIINGLLNCPLAKAVDLVNTHPESIVYTNYSLWFGWQFVKGAYMGGGNAGKGMFRLGDHFEWKDPTVPSSPRHRFRVLAADSETADYPTGSILQTSHPDYGKGERLVNAVLQDQVSPTAGVMIDAGTRLTASVWTGGGKVQRGLLDRQFVYDDGSVERYTALTLNDGRLVLIPSVPNYASDRTTWLPER